MKLLNRLFILLLISFQLASCLQTNSSPSAPKALRLFTKSKSASINLNSRVDVDFSSLLREYPNLTRLHIANSSGHSSAVISKTLSVNPILKLKPIGSNGHYTVTVFLPNSSVTKIIR